MPSFDIDLDEIDTKKSKTVGKKIGDKIERIESKITTLDSKTIHS